MKLKNMAKMSLAIALVFGASSAITGCNNDDTTQTEKTEQEKIYDLYVAYMSAQGQTPASYQDWLNLVKGEKGDKGDTGNPGTNGATWYNGSESPNVNTGVNGDLYFKTDTADVYVKENGAWVLKANIKGEKGDAAQAPVITIDSVDGTWVIDGVDTNKPSTGESGVTPTVEINDDGNWEINGVDTGVLAQGIKGQDGNKWYHGDGEPTKSEVDNLGDYYVDTTNKDIYFRNEGGWVKLFSLDEDKTETNIENLVLEEGVYINTREEYGEVYQSVLTLDNEGNPKFEINVISALEEGNNISEGGLIITSVDENTVTLGLETEIPDSSIENLDPKTTYQVVNTEVDHMGMTIVFNGSINGDGTVVELTMSQTLELEVISIDTIGELIRLEVDYFGEKSVSYFALGDVIDYQDGSATEIVEAPYFSEEDETLLFGTYHNVDSSNNFLTISKNRILLSYMGIKITAPYEIIAGSVDSGYAEIKFDTQYVSFVMTLELHEREFYVGETTYNYEGTYKMYVEDGYIEIEVSKNEDEYVITLGDATLVSSSADQDDRYLSLTFEQDQEPMTLIFDSLTRHAQESYDGGGSSNLGTQSVAVRSGDELIQAVENRAQSITIMDGEEIKLDRAIAIDYDVIINLENCNITASNVEEGVFHVVKGGNLTINGNGTINGVGTKAIWAEGGNVIINRGTYTNENSDSDLIYASSGGTIEINGGTFICKIPQLTLNVEKGAEGEIYVRGGLFYAFNPSAANADDNLLEGEDPVNYVVAGYKVEEMSDDGEHYYNVVVEDYPEQ